MTQQILIEHIDSAEAMITESRDQTGSLFLAGRMMAAEQRNLNGRNYPLSEISRAVQNINLRLKEGHHIPGELNHPSDLNINLANVSHIITEAWMEGNNAVGKCKVLNTPSGLIVKALIEGGFKPGVSSRGTGNVNHQGMVEDFQFVTLDIVAQPSGPGCYPDIIREAVENTKVKTLAEAVLEDEKAQDHFKKAIYKFMNSIVK